MCINADNLETYFVRSFCSKRCRTLFLDSTSKRTVTPRNQSSRHFDVLIFCTISQIFTNLIKNTSQIHKTQ